MRQYFVMPRSSTTSWDDWFDTRASDHLPRTVHEAEIQPRDTGLLDKDGRKLFSVEPRRPIGFVWPKP